MNSWIKCLKYCFVFWSVNTVTKISTIYIFEFTFGENSFMINWNSFAYIASFYFFYLNKIETLTRMYLAIVLTTLFLPMANVVLCHFFLQKNYIYSVKMQFWGVEATVPKFAWTMFRKIRTAILIVLPSNGRGSH